MTWINTAFPAAVGSHEVTSPCDGEYNCIAYAAGNKSEWWTHLPGYKWPGKRTPIVTGLVGLFESLGFERCDSPEPESGYEKVAIYAKGGLWKHAARQTSSGKWTSKLGPDEDIEHASPFALCGDLYGTVHCFMRRNSHASGATQPKERKANLSEAVDGGTGAAKGNANSRPKGKAARST